MDDAFDDTIKQLESKVGQISGNFTSTAGAASTNTRREFLSGIMSSKKLMYLLPPLLIFLVLYFFKPKIVLEEVVDDDGNIEEKVSIKRTLIATIFLVTLGAGGIYYFKQRKNT